MFQKGFTNPSVMNHKFSHIPQADIQRSNFDRSHGHKTAFDAGLLVPIMVDEVLPGDSFNLNMSAVARLATPIVPIMDNMMMDFFFFFVPNRLVWDNFQKFMGEQINPGDSTAYLVPQVPAPAGGFAVDSVFDYMGIPTGITDFNVNNLHGRAYNLIYNEWFRDQNLQNSVTVDRDDGPDSDTDYSILRRGKRHDYFTSCLPWPQKGVGVELPLGTTAPIAHDGIDNSPLTTLAPNIGAGDYGLDSGGSTLIAYNVDPGGSGFPLYADLSSATAATINSLREAFQLQRLLERDARGGTRYTEILQSHFLVTSPDARLQRPEYLGGGSRPVVVTPIPNTSDTATANQGDLAAIGYTQASGIGFTKSFVEHGVIIGLVCVRADLTYQQGLHRMWSRQTKYDYYWPALAHLGEQEVTNRELWLQTDSTDTGATGTPDNDRIFGYQERWAEYRYKNSQITGILRSDAAGSLDVWHLSEDFATLPELNADFIECDPPVDRAIAVPAEPHFIFDSYFKLTCTRPMPTYSVPGLIDHF